MNVFFKIGDSIITPPLDGTILPGVTRDSVLQILDSEGLKVEVRPLALDELLEAARSGTLKEVFGSGTAASISPVDSLGIHGENVQVGDGKAGPVSTLLKKRLTDIQYGRVEDPWGWTLSVNSSP
jgi:branched-chain amino acid aminotransferase